MSAAYLYVARVAQPPRRVLRQLASIFGSFFWGGKTEKVARVCMRLPPSKGGFSLLCLPTVSSFLAVRNMFALASFEKYPGRQRVQYFL